MCRSPVLCAVLALLMSGVATAGGAQARLSARERVRFTAPAERLDSTTVQLHVVDAVTGEAVEARLCFYGGREAATDSAGEARVSSLTRRNVATKVMARGYRTEGLVFMPGKLGRSNAKVRLEPDPNAIVEPTCAQAEWPA